LALYYLTDKKGKLWKLSDRKNGLFYCLEYQGRFYDINGNSELKKKIEYLPITNTTLLTDWQEITSEMIEGEYQANRAIKISKDLKSRYERIEKETI